jgi:hypothetical protein
MYLHYYVRNLQLNNVAVQTVFVRGMWMKTRLKWSNSVSISVELHIIIIYLRFIK